MNLSYFSSIESAIATLTDIFPFVPDYMRIIIFDKFNLPVVHYQPWACQESDDIAFDIVGECEFFGDVKNFRGYSNGSKTVFIPLA